MGNPIHKHSIIAFNEITGDDSKIHREKAVLDVFEKALKPLRDYDVLRILYPGSSDMNLVRPRITDLYRKNKLIECSKALSHSGNRPVRTSKIRIIAEQLKLSM